MIATQSQPTKDLSYSPRVVVELDGVYANLRNALDHIILYHRLRSPLMPPDQTAVVRSLIADEYARIVNPDGQGLLRCPQCDALTVADPHRPGVRYCLSCDEPVQFGDNGNGSPEPAPVEVAS